VQPQPGYGDMAYFSIVLHISSRSGYCLFIFYDIVIYFQGQGLRYSHSKGAAISPALN
jgi:hypothetical protein